MDNPQAYLVDRFAKAKPIDNINLFAEFKIDPQQETCFKLLQQQAQFLNDKVSGVLIAKAKRNIFQTNYQPEYSLVIFSNDPQDIFVFNIVQATYNPQENHYKIKGFYKSNWLIAKTLAGFKVHLKDILTSPEVTDLITRLYLDVLAEV